MRNIPVDQLVEVARSSRRSDRSALAEAIGDLCLKTGRSLSNREKSLAYDIISALIRDVETHVRSALATNLATQNDAPHDLISTLANDVIEVARPIIVHSVVLQDEDLVQMILSKAEEHQLAIAGRETVSPKVTDTLVRTENTKVINAALTNVGAKFSERSLNDVLNMARSDESLQGALVQRQDLSTAQARAMYQFVGQELQRALEQRLETVDELNDLDMDSVIEKAVAEALEEEDFGSVFDPVASMGSGMGGLKPHPRLLVGALEQNDLFRFEELFQDLTDLSEQGATRVLYDSGPEAIAIACKATGFDRRNFADLLSHLQGGGEPEKYRTSAAYIKLMDYFERIDRTGAERVLAAWRRAPEESWQKQ